MTMASRPAAPSSRAGQGSPRARYALAYPVADRSDVVDILHGRAVPDPYRWLEDWDDPRTRRWQDEQQVLAGRYLGALPGRQSLLGAIRKLRVERAGDPPVRAGRWRLRLVRSPRGGGARIEACDEDGAGWRIVADETCWGAGGLVRSWQPSPGGRYLSVQTACRGAERVTTLHVIETAGGRVVDRSTLTRYSPICWRADEESLLYVRRHRERPESAQGVYEHRIAADDGTDDLVYTHDDNRTRYGLALWHDRWLIVSTRSGADRDGRGSVVIDLAAEDRTAVPLGLSATSASGLVVDERGRFLAISTDGADFGQVLVADRVSGEKGDWSVLIPQAPPAVLRAMVPCRGLTPRDRFLLLLDCIDGVSRLSVRDAAAGRLIAEARLPGAGTVGSISVNPAAVGTEVVDIGYTDWTTPLRRYALDITTGRVRGLHRPDVPPGHVAERLPLRVTTTTYRSFDDVDVPITVITRETAAARPTMLVCYGGFGSIVRPRYQPDLLAWVLAGGTVAIAAVRGGGERGRAWHRQGRAAGRVNALGDLHAAADWLTASGYVLDGRLALNGGSHGGLLVAGAVIQRPHAYAAAAIGAAPLDMIRYELSGLGHLWRAEYGSATEPGAFPDMLSLSPYHNVDAAAGYPPMLFYTGANDTRVDPLHSRKMVAALQRADGAGPVVYHTVAAMGHLSDGGAAGEELGATVLAFLAHHCGLDLVGGLRDLAVLEERPTGGYPGHDDGGVPSRCEQPV